MPPSLEERVRHIVDRLGSELRVAEVVDSRGTLSDTQRVLAGLPRENLLEVLAEIGYGDIKLGPYEIPQGGKMHDLDGEQISGRSGASKVETVHMDDNSVSGGPDDKTAASSSSVLINEQHDGLFCQTEVAHHMTVPVETPLPSVFIEEDSSVVAHHHHSARGGAISEPVSCACDEFDCTCRKQCFCKTQSEPFPTSQPKSCPVCKSCDGTPVPKPDEDNDDMGSSGIPDKPNPPPHEFKCSCSFDGGGGSKMGSKNAMDCDCKVSDCNCVRKCKCRAPGS